MSTLMPQSLVGSGTRRVTLAPGALGTNPLSPPWQWERVDEGEQGKLIDPARFHKVFEGMIVAHLYLDLNVCVRLWSDAPMMNGHIINIII